MQILNKDQAGELRDVMGGRVIIPGPDDDVPATLAKALLKVAGFTVKRKRVKSAGQRWYRYDVNTL